MLGVRCFRDKIIKTPVSEPIHQTTEIGSEFASHLLILIDIGMVVVAVELLAGDGSHVEAIDFLVACLLSLSGTYVVASLERMRHVVVGPRNGAAADQRCMSMLAQHLGTCHIILDQ